MRNVVIGIGLAVILALTVLTGLALKQSADATEQSEIARVQAVAAQADLWISRGEDERGALLAREAYLLDQRTPGASQATIDHALRTALDERWFTVVLDEPAARIASVAFSQDGRYLAAGSTDGRLWLWTVGKAGATPIGVAGRGVVVSVAFGPANAAGQTLAVGTTDGTVRLWAVGEAGAELLDTSPAESPVTSVAFSDDGRLLAAGTFGGIVALWEVRGPDIVPLVPVPIGTAVASVAFGPAWSDGQLLAAGTVNGIVGLWSVGDASLHPIPLETPQVVAAVTSVAFSPDGRLLVAGGCGQLGQKGLTCVRGAVPLLWSVGDPGAVSNPEELAVSAMSLPAPPDTPNIGQVSSVAIGPDGPAGPLLAAGSADGTIHVWAADTRGASQAPLPPVRIGPAVASVAFSPDGRLLAAGSADGTVQLWSVSQPTFLQAGGASVSSFAFGPVGSHGRIVAVGACLRVFEDACIGGGEVRLWAVGEPGGAPTELGSWQVTGPVSSVTFSTDGQTLATASNDGRLWLWTVREAGAELTLLDTRRVGTGVLSVALSPFGPDGRFLVAASTDGRLFLWAVGESDVDLVAAVPIDARVASVAFGPEGRFLAIRSADGRLWLWSVGEPKATPIALPADAIATSVVFSPDGRTIAAGAADGIVRMWPIERPGAEPVSLAPVPAAGSIASVAFSPDGRFLAVGSADGIVRLSVVDDPNGEPIVLSTLAASPVASVAFSPDGRSLGAIASKSNVRVWATTQGLVELVCSRVWRNLSVDEWERYVSPDLDYESTCESLPSGDGPAAGPLSVATPD